MRDTWERLYGAEGDLIDRSGCCLEWRSACYPRIMHYALYDEDKAGAAKCDIHCATHEQENC